MFPGKKVVNHGDSFQSRRGSRSSISSRGSGQSGDSHSTSHGHHNTPHSPWSGRSSAWSSRANSRPTSRQSSSCSPSSRRNSERGWSYRTSQLSAHSRCSSPCVLQLEEQQQGELTRVLIIGGEGVGKSSLCAQFVTSEYVNTYHVVGESFIPKISFSKRNLSKIHFKRRVTVRHSRTE